MNTQELVDTIVLRGGFSPGSYGMSNQDILKLASQEAGSYLLGFVRSIREEFGVAQLPAVSVSSSYEVPNRASGGSFRLVEASWDGGSSFQPLPRIEPENAGWFGDQGSGPVGFQFRGNNLHLVPTQSSAILLRVSYLQRLGTLVLPSQAGLVTSVAGTTASFASLPSTFTSNADYDLISGDNNHQLLAAEQTAIRAGSTMAFSSLPSGFGVGSWVALSETSPVVQLPEELSVLLACEVAYKVNQLRGSQYEKSTFRALQEQEHRVKNLISPRSDGNGKPIVSRTAPGWYPGWRSGPARR